MCSVQFLKLTMKQATIGLEGPDEVLTTLISQFTHDSLNHCSTHSHIPTRPCQCHCQYLSVPVARSRVRSIVNPQHPHKLNIPPVNNNAPIFPLYFVRWDPA